MAETAVAKTNHQELGLTIPGINDSIFLSMERFEAAKKIASMLAASPMVPTIFQGPSGVGSCMIALNLAERMRVDPFMLMQNIYVVHGKPGLEGKLIIALVNGCTSPFAFTKLPSRSTHAHAGKTMAAPAVRSFSKMS